VLIWTLAGLIGGAAVVVFAEVAVFVGLVVLVVFVA
jgi:hypothetical protein